MARMQITDRTGTVKGYIEKVGDVTNAYDSNGSMLGYSNSTGTFTKDGIKQYSSDSAAMLIDR